MASVKFKSQHTKPLFPECKVSQVPKIKDEEREEFVKKHISSEYIHDYSSPEAKERLDEVEENQFKRWKWDIKNVSTLVNMFREAGHSDEKIQKCLTEFRFVFPTRNSSHVL